MNTNVTLILISHKSRELVLKFISNIYDKFEIIILDNSNDIHLKKEIKKKYPKILFKIIENFGYGSAINVASRLVKTKYFLVSNPDIEGINKQTILEFLKVANKLKDKFSVLGPRFLNVNPKSHKQSINNSDIAEMQFLSGACMFFNKKNFDLIGGFDENFFLYFEENDFCFRSHKINKNYQINSIQIKHNAGKSVKIENHKEELKLSNLRTWHFIWSKFYYYKKHYTFILAIIFFIPIIFRIKFKIYFYTLLDDKSNAEKYSIRWSGLKNSILNKKSFKRI